MSLFEEIKRFQKYPMLYKYEHIVFGVMEQINCGKLVKGEKLPSINEMKKALGYSRMTIDRSYKCLVAEGLVNSFRLRGYYLTGKRVKVIGLNS